MLKAGAGDVNMVDPEEGDTPLHVACRCGHLELAQWLVGEGASMTATNAAGETPLHDACFHGGVALVEWLLDQPADSTTAANLIDRRTPARWRLRRWIGGTAELRAAVKASRRGADVGRGRRRQHAGAHGVLKRAWRRPGPARPRRPYRRRDARALRDARGVRRRQARRGVVAAQQAGRPSTRATPGRWPLRVRHRGRAHCPLAARARRLAHRRQRRWQHAAALRVPGGERRARRGAHRRGRGPAREFGRRHAIPPRLLRRPRRALRALHAKHGEPLEAVNRTGCSGLLQAYAAGAGARQVAAAARARAARARRDGDGVHAARAPAAGHLELAEWLLAQGATPTREAAEAQGDRAVSTHQKALRPRPARLGTARGASSS